SQEKSPWTTSKIIAYLLYSTAVLVPILYFALGKVVIGFIRNEDVQSMFRPRQALWGPLNSRNRASAERDEEKYRADITCC
ncbi:hypothetical protein AB6A40_010814, partial [Gnathostoma spinigerum]